MGVNFSVISLDVMVEERLSQSEDADNEGQYQHRKQAEADRYLHNRNSRKL